MIIFAVFAAAVAVFMFNVGDGLLCCPPFFCPSAFGCFSAPSAHYLSCCLQLCRYIGKNACSGKVQTFHEVFLKYIERYGRSGMGAAALMRAPYVQAASVLLLLYSAAVVFRASTMQATICPAVSAVCVLFCSILLLLFLFRFLYFRRIVQRVTSYRKGTPYKYAHFHLFSLFINNF